MGLLFALARAKVAKRRDAMFAGAHINRTEDRAGPAPGFTDGRRHSHQVGAAFVPNTGSNPIARERWPRRAQRRHVRLHPVKRAVCTSQSRRGASTGFAARPGVILSIWSCQSIQQRR